MIKQAVFNYKTLTWIFLAIPEHGRVNTITRMNGYYVASTNGLVADFDLDELEKAIMWVETKIGVSNYTFNAKNVAIF